MSFTVGVDFGGTNVKIGLVRPDGRVVELRVVAAASAASPRTFLDVLHRVVAEWQAAHQGRLIGIGVGAPGLIDVRQGIVRRLVNVPGWRQVPLRRLLERRFGAPAAVDNDANAVTVGEWRAGAGRGARHLVCLTLGTGVGGGLILDGRLYRGAFGAAGEAGHLVVDPRGRRCACGGRGCLETVVGTLGIVRAARRTRCVAGRAVTPEMVARAARRGSAAAKAVWRDVGSWLGVGISTLVNLLNPDRIVLAGGLANAWGLFLPSLRETMRRHVLDGSRQAARIVRGTLGPSAGVIGAAAIVWEQAGER